MTTLGGWTVHLQAAVQADPHGYDQPGARYNDPAVVYGGADPAGMWVTLDCQVTAVFAAHGGSADETPGLRARLGRLTAALYDPTRTLDPAASPYALLTNPGAPVRLIAVHATLATRIVWTGQVDTWTHDLLEGTGQLSASDNVGFFSGVEVTEFTRPAETSRARYAACAGMVPETLRFTYTGTDVALSEAKFSGDMWSSAITSTSVAEQSMAFFDRTGAFRRLPTMGDFPAGEIIQAVDCDDGVAPLVYSLLSTTTDDDVLANVVQAERLNIGDTDRVPITRSSQDSVYRYGSHPLKHTALPLPNDAALTGWADRVLDLRAFPTVEPTGLEVFILESFEWAARILPTVIGMEVGDALDIRLSSRGEAERWLAVVASVEHTITADEWALRMELLDAPRLALNLGYDAPSSIYGQTKYGRAGDISPMEVPA